MATEDLYVGSLGADKTEWTEVGSTPFLDAAEGDDSNYVHSATKKDEHGDFAFDNTAQSGNTFVSCNLYVYGLDSADDTMDIWVSEDNGTSWTEYANWNFPDAAYGWVNMDVTATIADWTKVDACEIYLEKGNNSNQVKIDAAYIQNEYTVPAAGGQVIIISQLDSWFLFLPLLSIVVTKWIWKTIKRRL